MKSKTPQAASSEEVTTATADLTTNQVTVDDQTVQVADLSQPIAEAPKAVETTSTKEVATSSEVAETVATAEEVAPSTNTSTSERSKQPKQVVQLQKQLLRQRLQLRKMKHKPAHKLLQQWKQLQLQQKKKQRNNCNKFRRSKRSLIK